MSNDPEEQNGERIWILSIVSIMVVAALAVGLLSIHHLYRVSLQGHKQMLQHLVIQQASMIEAVARYDAEAHAAWEAAVAAEMTLGQIRDAIKSRSDHEIEQQQELLIGHKVADQIEYLLASRHAEVGVPKKIDWNDIHSDEAMRRALQGQTGVHIGPDCDRVEVIAAYAPLEPLQMGLVIQTPMQSFRAPFVTASFWLAGLSSGVLLLGIAASSYFSRRLLKRAREREHHQRLLFEWAQIGYVVLKDDMIVDCNRKAVEILGHDEAFIKGSHAVTFSPIYQPDGTRSLDKLEDLLSTSKDRRDFRVEWQCLHPQKGQIDLQVTATQLELGGEPHVIASFWDITESKAQKKLLRIQEQAMQATRNGILIGEASKEKDCPIIWANGAFTRMTGYAAEDVLGRNCRFLQGTDRQQPGREVLARATREGTSADVTLRNYRKDGSLFINHIHLDPIYDETGQVTHFVAVQRDITAEVEQHDRLRLFQKIADQSPVSILVTDFSGNITYVNNETCRISEYSREELIGKNPRTLKSKETDPAIYAELWQAVTHGLTWRGTLVNRKKSGVPYTEEVTIFPVRNEERMISHFVAEKRDVTEAKRVEAQQKALNQQLAQLQRVETIGTLAGGIAHDFNNIIGAIRGWAELAQRHAKGQPEVLNDLDHILTATRRSQDLVRQILTFSRQQDVEKQSVDLHSLLEETVKLLQPTIPRDVAFTLTINTSHAVIEADQSQIQQVILNLCLNALYAMKEGGGELRLSLDEVGAASLQNSDLMIDGPIYQLTVSDTGSGMDRNTQDRLFEPFFTTKPQGEGTGMGLAVCYGIVKSCSGQISVQSELGAGTCFTVLLPAISGIAAPPPNAIPSPVKGTARILLVDDDCNLLEINKRQLEDCGYTVAAFADSPEALRHLQEGGTNYDILVTDQLMPQLNGIDLLTQYRLLDATLPAVIISGYGNSVDLKQLLDMGNVELLAKPCSIADLTAAIDRRLRASRVHI